MLLLSHFLNFLCFSILFAITKSIDSGLHETDAAQKNAVDLAVEDKESNSSNKEILTSYQRGSLPHPPTGTFLIITSTIFSSKITRKSSKEHHTFTSAI